MKSKKQEIELLTVPDVAELCNISTETVRRLSDSGSMPKPVRLGRLIRYRKQELTDWIKDGCPKLIRRKK